MSQRSSCSTRTLLSVSVATTLLWLVAVLTGCGVPIDDSPRAITNRPTDQSTDTLTTISTTGSDSVGAYFLRGDRLELVEFSVAEQPTLSAALNSLLNPPATSLSEGLLSAIPPGTRLNRLDVTNETATIDLTSEINDVSGQSQKEAFAQIVFTALEFEDVTSVRFLVDGQLIDAPTDDGNRPEVSAHNFGEPLNPN